MNWARARQRSQIASQGTGSLRDEHQRERDADRRRWRVIPRGSTFWERWHCFVYCDLPKLSNSIQHCPHFGFLMRQLGYAIAEGEMAYIRETEEFDQETLHILGNALDEAWRRVKSNHLNGRAYGARTVLAQHIFAMAKQGERDPHRLIDGALMRLTL